MSEAWRFAVGADGWVDGARREPSPNLEARPDGAAISLVVLHDIRLPPGESGRDAIVALFQKRLDWARHARQ
ncbi:N-acetylmuramoyl-L-alanine amidase, partial [Burkholderia pseudomallei]